MSTALYRRYLAETKELLDEMDEQTIQDADVLDESSTVLCWLFEDHLQSGVVLPQWCAPMTLHQYQNRAFEQPRSVLEGLVHPESTPGRGSRGLEHSGGPGDHRHRPAGRPANQG